MKKLMKVEGMHCGGCSGRLKRTLEAMPGVESAEASHEDGTASVVCDASVTDEALKAAVEGANFQFISVETVAFHLAQQVLRGDTEELGEGYEVRRARVGRAALPLADGLTAHAQRLGHELLRHLALGPPPLYHLAQRPGLLGPLLPHRLRAQILAQRLYQQVYEIGDDRIRHDGHNGKYEQSDHALSSRLRRCCHGRDGGYECACHVPSSFLR